MSRSVRRALVGEHRVVHLPELALGGRRLRSLGGHLRVGVHVVERQVAPHVAQVAEVREQLADDRLRPAAVRDTRGRRTRRGSPRRPGARARGRARRRPAPRGRRSSRRCPPARAAAGRAAASWPSAAPASWRSARPPAWSSTPSLASASSWPWKARVAISSETVNPMPAIAPPPSTDAQPTGGRIRPLLSRVTSQAPAGDAQRLSDQVGEQDAERDRRAVGQRPGSGR